MLLTFIFQSRTYNSRYENWANFDTHNSISYAEKATALLIEAEVSAVLHCGDICSAAVWSRFIPRYSPKKIPLFFVLGNCDFVSIELCNYPNLDDLKMCGRFGVVEFADKKIAFLHGDDSQKFAQSVNSEEFDYIITRSHPYSARQKNRKNAPVKSRFNNKITVRSKFLRSVRFRKR